MMGYRFQNPNWLLWFFSILLVVGGFCFGGLVTCESSLASTQESAQEGGQPSTHSTTQGIPAPGVLPSTTTWKFAVSMSGTGNTTGTQVTFPLPVDWPDQKVELVSIDSTPNVKGARMKKLGSDARQMFFKVPRLQAGEKASVVVTMKIVKPESVAPQDTSVFRFGKRSGKKFRSYLSPSPYIESKHERILEIAKSLPIDSSDDAWDQVKTIYQWVRENIDYKFDPQIQSCLTALDRRTGDCEELSSLFIALCRARGIPARAVWIPDHTYPEFYLEDQEGNGRWFPCQCAGSYAFGHMPEIKPILQKGDKFKVPGLPKPVRYIQPTMKASGASPSWQWEMKQVKK